jgi:hypothetical protein
MGGGFVGHNGDGEYSGFIINASAPLNQNQRSDGGWAVNVFYDGSTSSGNGSLEVDAICALAT